jgi:predicted TIM-barrel fold metal-dependent hydrolase
LAAELIAAMDSSGVDKALIWLRPLYSKEIASENRAVYEAQKMYSSRLLGFGWANPRLGKQHCLDTIKQCFEEYGLYGIKFNGAQDDYLIDDKDLAMPFIEKAASYGKPIAFHIGADYYENTHPWRLGHIAARFPENTFISVHMGGASKPPLHRAMIEIAAQYPNIHLIGSAIPEYAILQAIKVLGADRLSYGSDMPFQLLHVELAAYGAMLRDTPPADRDKIMGGNLARVLGL